MEVEAHFYYWTPGGMVRQQPTPHAEPYLMKREVEDLLNQAHRRGFEEGAKAAEAVVRTTQIRPG